MLALVHRGSPLLAVTSVYSDHTYLPWLFRKASKTVWKSLSNRDAYISWLMKRVGVEKPDDLKASHFLENRGAGLLAEYHWSPQMVLDSLKPDSEASKPDFKRKPTALRFWVPRRITNDKDLVYTKINRINI